MTSPVSSVARSAPKKTLHGVPGYPQQDQGAAFDRLVHERVRLGVLSALAVNKSLSFSEM